MNNKGTDQTAQMHRLFCTFVVPTKQVLSWHGSLTSIQTTWLCTKSHLFCSISGPYHPFLDTQTDMFRLESVFALSRITGLEPVRFQRTRLDWDIDNIYITTTMVGQIPQVMSKCLNKYICTWWTLQSSRIGRVQQSFKMSGCLYVPCTSQFRKTLCI